MPPIDADEWAVTVAGSVLTLTELESMPQDTFTAILDCTGGWYSEQEWSGVRLDRLIDPVESRSFVAWSATGYARRFPIADLDSKTFAVRQKATEELEKLGELAVPALEDRLQNNPSLEVKQRLEKLLAKLQTGLPPPPETRPETLLTTWRSRDRDPVTRFEDDLKSRGVVTEDAVHAIREAVQRALKAAVTFAEASPFPDPKDLLVDMFAE